MVDGEISFISLKLSVMKWSKQSGFMQRCGK